MSDGMYDTSSYISSYPMAQTIPFYKSGYCKRNLSAAADELAKNLESLITRAHAVGLTVMDDHILSRDERMLMNEILEFLPIVETTFDNKSALYIVRLYSLYDITYRIGNRHAPSKELLPRLFTRAMNLWLKGDNTVTEEDLIAMHQHVNQRNIDFKYTDWSINVQNKWIAELENNGGRFKDTTDRYKIQQRLSILLRANLWPYFADKEKEVKKNWMKANMIDCESLRANY